MEVETDEVRRAEGDVTAVGEDWDWEAAGVDEEVVEEEKEEVFVDSGIGISLCVCSTWLVLSSVFSVDLCCCLEEVDEEGLEVEDEAEDEDVEVDEYLPPTFCGESERIWTEFSSLDPSCKRNPLEFVGMERTAHFPEASAASFDHKS